MRCPTVRIVDYQSPKVKKYVLCVMVTLIMEAMDIIGTGLKNSEGGKKMPKKTRKWKIEVELADKGYYFTKQDIKKKLKSVLWMIEWEEHKEIKFKNLKIRRIK